jgi:hypothetical protein
MDPDKLRMVLQLRQWVIDRFAELQVNQPTAQITHKEVGLTYESIIRSLEDLVKDDITIE